MKNLFEEDALLEIKDRIETLNNTSQPIWGEMNVAQMLAHCINVLDMASGKINPPRVFIGRLISSFVKSIYYNEKPFSKNAPTDKMIQATGAKDFMEEKNRLLCAIIIFW